jgi:hypothetical protein
VQWLNPLAEVIAPLCTVQCTQQADCNCASLLVRSQRLKLFHLQTATVRCVNVDDC